MKYVCVPAWLGQIFRAETCTARSTIVLARTIVTLPRWLKKLQGYLSLALAKETLQPKSCAGVRFRACSAPYEAALTWQDTYFAVLCVCACTFLEPAASCTRF